MAFSPHSAAISRGLKSLAFARNNNYPNPLSPDHLLSNPGRSSATALTTGTIKTVGNTLQWERCSNGTDATSRRNCRRRHPCLLVVGRFSTFPYFIFWRAFCHLRAGDRVVIVKKDVTCVIEDSSR